MQLRPSVLFISNVFRTSSMALASGQHQQLNQRPQNHQQQSYQQLSLPPTPHFGRSAPLWPPSLLESSPSHVANPPKATYPLLTSSGRAFAVGDKCDIWAAEGGQWFAKLKKGACVFLPKAFNFSRTVTGRIPTGCSNRIS